jgi:ATP-binding cassette subfamily B protein
VSNASGVGGAVSPDAPAAVPSTWYFIWRLTTYHPLPQLGSGLCWILFHSWPLFPGLLAKLFFDTLAGATPVGLTLESIVVLIVAFSLARAGFVYLDLRLGTLSAFRTRGLLQRNLLRRILDLPGAQPLPESTGDALSTFRDDVESMWGAGWAFDVVGFTVFAAGGLAILLWIDPLVTLLVFVPIVAVIAMTHVVRTRLRHRREANRAATARVTGTLGEVFGAVQAIQVAGAEARVGDHLRRLGDARRDAVLGDRLLGLGLEAALSSTANLGAGLTLLVAASALRTGAFTVGDFALFATYLMQVAEMTGFLGWIVATYQQMGVAFRRAVGLLQGAPPADLVAHHPLPVFAGRRRGPSVDLSLRRERPARPAGDRLQRLEVSGLTYRHAGTGRGIFDVSFALRPGQVSAVTGHVGAGKTTLLRATLGLLAAQRGEVRWNGKPVPDLALTMIPPRAAYTPQVPALLSGTLRENILLGIASADRSVEAAIRRAALARDVASLPAGLDTVVGAAGVRLSGGQALRTAAARMFVRDADLLVVDDVSSALDVETEALLWEQLFSLVAERDLACLVATYRQAVLRRADQVLVLDDGRLVGDGLTDGLTGRGEPV